MRWDLFFLVCLCHAQTTIHVRDEAGHPIEGAQLQFAGSKLFEDRTLANGSFFITNNAQFAVVRKAGFLTTRVNLDRLDVNVTLKQHAEREWQKCPPSVKCDLGSFCFPTSNEIVVRGNGRDIDYTQRFYARNSDGRRPKDVISHGQGPNWSSGLPRLEWVQSSTIFQEEAFPWTEPLWLLDSRGALKDGTMWRQIGKFGETLSYETKDKAVADAFDIFLDSMCLRP